MTAKEKKIPQLLNDPAYLTGLFNARITDIDPTAVKLLNLQSHKIKAHFDHQFFHFVLYHNLTYETLSGLRKRCIVLSIAFSSHGRRWMYAALELAYHHGFAQGSVIVPRPLWYLPELMAAFYIGLPGDNLLEHIKNNYLNLTTIKKIANGLSKLHDIPKPKSFKLKKHDFSPVFLDPTNVIGRPYNAHTRLAQDVLAQFKQLKQAKKKLIKGAYAFSHGDFHPENVIINKFNNNQVVFIDFSEVCLAPVYFDIASFLQQLEFMTLSYLSPKAYAQIEYVLLSSYFNRKHLDTPLLDRINLYKSWTALKSSVYFMIFEDATKRRFAEELLTRSEDLYRQIKL